MRPLAIAAAVALTASSASAQTIIGTPSGGSSSAAAPTNAATLQTSPPAPQSGSVGVGGDLNAAGNANVSGNMVAGGIGSFGQLQAQSAQLGAPGFGIGLGSTAQTAAGHLLGGGFRLQSMLDPAAPVAAPINATGAATVTYYVVALDAYGNRTNAVASNTLTNSQALGALNTTNFNLVQWFPVSGAVAYEILRSTAGLSTATLLVQLPVPGPLTIYDQGQYLNVAVQRATSQPYNYTAFSRFDGPTALNRVIGPVTLTALTTPAAPILSYGGTAGATTRLYAVACVMGSVKTQLSAFTSIPSTLATLDDNNAVLVQWDHYPGCDSYDVVATNATGPWVNVPANPSAARQFLEDAGTARTPQLTGNYSQVARNATADVTLPAGASLTLGSGITIAGPTAAIAAGACATDVTVAYANALTTSAFSWSFNAVPPATYNALTVSVYPTAGNANLHVCNPSAGSVTPVAATFNVRAIN